MLERLNLADIENVWGGSKNNQNSGGRTFSEKRGMMVPSNATFSDNSFFPYFYCFYNTEEERKTLESMVNLSSAKVVIAIQEGKFSAINVQSLVNKGCPDWLIKSHAEKFFNKYLKK